MAKKNSRSDNSTSGTPRPAPARRRTARATTRSAAQPDAVTAEPDGSPAVVRATANDMAAEGNEATRTPTFDEIAEAAYHRYLQRGGQHGYDFDDWVDAERSLRSRQEA